MILELNAKRKDYALREIAEICRIENIRTARYYLNQILPDSHRRGRGKYVKYPEETLNCFLLLKKLKDETPLRLEQISAVMKSLEQAQIDRIISGEEPLEISLAVKDNKGRVRIPKELLKRGESSALLVDGDTVEILEDKVAKISLNKLLDATEPEEKRWTVHPVSKNVEVRYRGELSKEKLEELEVVSRLLKPIIEN